MVGLPAGRDWARYSCSSLADGSAEFDSTNNDSPLASDTGLVDDEVLVPLGASEVVSELVSLVSGGSVEPGSPSVLPDGTGLVGSPSLDTRPGLVALG
jgi:hypothetical protein